MNIVDTMPESGQFIAFWVYCGRIWGHTYEWRNGELFRYDQRPDMFEHDPYALDALEEQEAKFLIP